MLCKIFLFFLGISNYDSVCYGRFSDVLLIIVFICFI